jgi:2'-5' RNA ligase
VPAIRTFIAVELSDAVRQRVTQLVEQLSHTRAKVKWVSPANMHLTLKFLGDVPQEKTAAVCEATAEAVREVPAFDAECVGAGAFPTAKRPSTIWLGMGRGAEELGKLQKAIEKALSRIGFPREGRRYTPHLTVGRVRGGGKEISALGELLGEHGDFQAGESRIDQVTVFASDLTPTGPVYTVLGRAPLRS